MTDYKQEIEELADIEHQRWSDWQAWCHKILRENCPSPELEKVLERWDKQIATPYKDLSEQEKQSDRDQVARYFPILTHLINKAREKDLQKYLDQMREIMAENFHYRTICGDIKDPSGKQDINELFIKYQELEPEREKFANYVEDRIKELEGKE